MGSSTAWVSLATWSVVMAMTAAVWSLVGLAVFQLAGLT